MSTPQDRNTSADTQPRIGFFGLSPVRCVLLAVACYILLAGSTFAYPRAVSAGARPPALALLNVCAAILAIRIPAFLATAIVLYLRRTQKAEIDQSDRHQRTK
jgi:hypothetical protein